MTCDKYSTIYEKIMSWDDPLWHDWLEHKKVCDICDRAKRPSAVIDLQRLQKWILRHTKQMRLPIAN